METSVNSLLQDLIEARSGGEDKVPEGHLSAEGWSKEWGVSLTQTWRLIKTGKDIGRLKEVSYRIRKGGHIRIIPHYYEIPKE